MEGFLGTNPTFEPYSERVLQIERRERRGVMPISSDLLKILCCPQTKVPVEVLPEEKLTKLNAQIQAGAVSFVDGAVVDKPLQEALITEDNQTIYRIEDDIPVMLVDQGIQTRQIPDW